MMSGNMADGSTGNYDATRTATSAENGTATFMGMNATMWTAYHWYCCYSYNCFSMVLCNAST